MQLYYNGFIPFCVYTTYFTLPSEDINFPASNFSFAILLDIPTGTSFL
ncbi:protein of unknown function [Streptococcus thermophilus]|nr:protein of unknown function [Streptococcus thermophilus]